MNISLVCVASNRACRFRSNPARQGDPTIREAIFGVVKKLGRKQRGLARLLFQTGKKSAPSHSRTDKRSSFLRPRPSAAARPPWWLIRQIPTRFTSERLKEVCGVLLMAAILGPRSSIPPNLYRLAPWPWLPSVQPLFTWAQASRIIRRTVSLASASTASITRTRRLIWSARSTH